MFYEGVKDSIWKDGEVVQLCVQCEYGIFGLCSDVFRSFGNVILALCCGRDKRSVLVLEVLRKFGSTAVVVKSTLVFFVVSVELSCGLAHIGLVAIWAS